MIEGLGAIPFGQQDRHVAGNPRHELYELRVMAAELRPVLLLNKLRQPPVNSLQPEHNNHVALGECQLVTIGASIEALDIDVWSNQMSGEEIHDTTVENVIIFILASLDVSKLEKACPVQREIVSAEDDVSNALP